MDCDEEESEEERNTISCGMGNWQVYKSMSVEQCVTIGTFSSTDLALFLECILSYRDM